MFLQDFAYSDSEDNEEGEEKLDISVSWPFKGGNTLPFGDPTLPAACFEWRESKQKHIQSRHGCVVPHALITSNLQDSIDNVESTTPK